MLLTSKARALPPFLAAMAATTLLAACSSSTLGSGTSTVVGKSIAMPAICTKAGPVVFAVSGRQDSPTPGLTTRMQTALETAARQSSAVGLVEVDGAPKLIAAGSADTSKMNGPAAGQFDGNFVAAVAGNRRASGRPARTLTCWTRWTWRAARSARPARTAGPYSWRTPGSRKSSR